MPPRDAIVIGAGPNGLAAAITLARAGLTVQLREAAHTVGGSARSAPLTLPGFTHDVCSTVHVLASASPFFRDLPLAQFGLELVHPQVPFAHPLDDGTAAVCERSIDATCATLGADADAYRRLITPIVENWQRIIPSILAPPRLPAHPLAVARFGMTANRSARAVANRFTQPHARALFAGAAAHSMLPLDSLATAAFALVLTAGAHAVGWPVARGGSQRLADALANYLRSLGGEILTDAPLNSLDELPPANAILCDLTPVQMLQIARHRLPPRYAKRLQQFQYGPGIFKMDWALSAPIPWKAPACARAGTVHLGGTFDEIAHAEAACWRGEVPRRPFVLLVQPTHLDPTRAPARHHTAWAYCHVPSGSTVDMSAAIEDQIERFAPGFRDVVLARSAMNTAQMQRYNPNLIGGAINGGAQTLTQMFRRPVFGTHPYATPVPNLYICSASTPPGAGVHGMCGFHAAQTALRRVQRPP
jgi:phytoene dehydrogenase-like protein